MESITVSMNFHHSLPLVVAHYPLQSLKGICKTLRLCFSVYWMSVQAWFFCWSAEEVEMGTTEPVAIFLVADQCIQLCFLLRAKVQRALVCLWGMHVVLQLVCLWQERHLE